MYRGVTVATYFRGIPEYLEERGFRVVLTQVPAAGTIAERAARMKEQIHARVQAGDVHIIAHSMGGLDARFMITHLGMEDRVASLTTLGTPHRGTVLADRLVDLTKESGIFRLLSDSPAAFEAFEACRTDACREFNAQTPDSPCVRYFSVAGEKKREEMLYALRFPYDVLAPAEGPNDGIVSTASARWGATLEIWDCDHVNMVNWTGPREVLAGYSRDVRPWYERLVQAVVRDRSETGGTSMC